MLVRRKTLSVLILLAMIPIGAFIYLLDGMNKGCDPDALSPHIKVAKVIIPVSLNTVLTRDMIAFESVPIKYLPEQDAIRKKDLEPFIGRRFKTSIESGAMLFKDDFEKSAPPRKSISIVP